MNLDHRKPACRLFCIGATALLALSLAACGEDQPPAEAATAKIESAADVVARQAQQAAAAAEKQKAEEAQQQAEAAKKAADEKKAADTALAEKVKAAIIATPGLKGMAMDVRSTDGEVTLFGTAESEAQRRQAQKVAAGVPEVKSVNNELKIVRGS